MCESCGCHDSIHAHGHSHDHPHDHGHGHPGGDSRTVEIRSSALALNQRFADQNRGWFRAKGWTVFNLLSSPGSGKTALLEQVLRALPGSAAIVGDLATDNDAARLRRSGAPAIQIQTGTACHLDAHQVAHAIDSLPADLPIRRLFIENVGNLVCPASFDLGEHKRIVLLSVTEGEDKPLKYPVVFATADLVLVTKTALAAAAGWARDAARRAIAAAAPRADVLEISSKTGENLPALLDWLARC